MTTPDKRTRFFVTEQLGSNTSRTPEGYLICHSVPIARTGVMIYGPEEVGIDPGPDGVVRLSREEDDIFNPATIASAFGKPVTNDHPDEDVTPDNWKDLAHGQMLNIRRGEGLEDDLLLADLMITSKELIKEIEEGKREVSLGYDASFLETGPGQGRQYDIIVNHLALVDQGRCGSRCAIADKKHQPSESESMKITNKQRQRALDARKRQKEKAFKDALKRFRDAETEEEANLIADEIAEMVNDGEGEVIPGNPLSTEDDDEVHIHLDGLPEGGAGASSSFTDDDIQQFVAKNEAEHADIFARLDALEAALKGTPTATATDEEFGPMTDMETAMADEFPEGLEEEGMKATDSRYLGASFKDTVALAEILSPGIQIPVYDSAANKETTFKKICGLRKKALDAASKAPETAAIIASLNRGRALDAKRMTCDAARAMFVAAANQVAAANNATVVKSGFADAGSRVIPAATAPKTLAEINEANRKFYSTQD